MLSVIAACLWILLAQLIAILPSKDRHWRAAYFLIAIGLPILVWVYLQNGFWIALLVLIGGMSILRWPVFYAYRFVMRLFRRPAGE